MLLVSIMSSFPPSECYDCCRRKSWPESFTCGWFHVKKSTYAGTTPSLLDVWISGWISSLILTVLICKLNPTWINYPTESLTGRGSSQFFGFKVIEILNKGFNFLADLCVLQRWMTWITTQFHLVSWWQISAVSDHNSTQYKWVFLCHLIQILSYFWKICYIMQKKI